MFNVEPVFCLSGCGYLNDLVEKNGKIIARIKLLSQYNVDNSDHDDISLDCEVEDKMQLFRLRSFVSKMRKGGSILLSFKAKYMAFVSAQVGQMPYDPAAMVTFQSKLLSLEDCYVDGQLASEYLRLVNAA